MNIEKGVPKAFRVEEAAKILGCSRSQIYVLLRTHELESAKIRGSRRITENQLVRYIKKIEGWTIVDVPEMLDDKSGTVYLIKKGTDPWLSINRNLSIFQFGLEKMPKNETSY